MWVTVLGGCGAWPEAGRACSGFVVEHDGFHLVVDLGYATVPRLLERMPAAEVDAVFISHGHPDHCADLNPLLRARVLGGAAAGPLPVYAPAGALDAVLALEPRPMLEGSFERHDFRPGEELRIGPFAAPTWLLPHWVPNAGVRLTVDGRSVAYTGDSGPSPDVVEMARDADLLIAEATYPDEVPEDSRRYLSSAQQAGRQAAAAEVRQLLLTHLWPGTDRGAAVAAACAGYGGPVAAATPGLIIDLYDVW